MKHFCFVELTCLLFAAWHYTMANEGNIFLMLYVTAAPALKPRRYCYFSIEWEQTIAFWSTYLLRCCVAGFVLLVTVRHTGDRCLGVCRFCQLYWNLKNCLFRTPFSRREKDTFLGKNNLLCQLIRMSESLNRWGEFSTTCLIWFCRYQV